MIFGKFLLNGYLMDDEPAAGGGSGAPAEPAAPAVPDFTKLFADMQKGIVGELDKRVNGINKETKKQIETLTAGLTALKTDLEGLRQVNQPQVPDDDEPTPPEPQPPAPPQPQQPTPQQQQPTPQNPPARRSKDPHTVALERQLEELKKQREADQEQMKRTAEVADKKERNSLLREALGKHKFSDQTMQQDLFDLLIAKVERGEDGNVYGPQGAELDEWVKLEYDRRPALHPAKPANGSGAGNAGSAGAAGRQFDIDSISPDMDADTLAAARLAIANTLKNRR
jgi:hypothetical protein